ncbi:MAG: 4-hydroxybenzoate 3-monooxygenase [Gemmatimonadaceae bacterium]
MIIGAGPAGLVLAHLLQQQGIESLVLERHTRDYVEHRLRAGVLEQTTVDLLNASGVGERMRELGLVHNGFSFQFEGERHRIALSDLTGGRAITVYGQHEVVKDLIVARLAAGGEIVFEAQDVTLHNVDGDRPNVRYSVNDAAHDVSCDFIAGCDGFHGPSRQSIPSGALRIYEKSYPFAWLGILAASPPATHELIYAHHERGFALNSMRSPELSRLYVQCSPDDSLDAWSDDRIWTELRARLATNDGWAPAEGPILERGITTMRSFVAEPMQWGRVYLAGDSAHVVPPTGAKGMNLAVADARALADALEGWYRTRSDRDLRNYSVFCLRRVWRAEHFSWWMTSMLHKFDDDPFQHRLQLSQLRYVCSSEAAATSLAENYVGLAQV